jgi:hypothetical protein
MRRKTQLLVIFLASALSCAAFAGPPPLVLTLRLESSKVKAGAPIFAVFELKNRSKKPVKVLSHIKTHELHYDWHRVKVTYPTPSREGCKGRYAARRTRWLTLSDERDKSYPVYRTLQPGKALSHRLDLGAWARRKVNRGFVMGGGFYKLQVEYRVSGKQTDDVWTGTLRSRPARLTVEGKWKRGMCRKNPGWRFF